MEKHRNVPMGFADATLVSLGEELDLNTVFTLDRSGFNVYRLHGRRPFGIIP
jgi:predicted nucleic acid-binding protein